MQSFFELMFLCLCLCLRDGKQFTRQAALKEQTKFKALGT